MSDRTKQKLIKLANQLDLEGLHEEANKVDAALQKYAQGLDLFKEEKNLLLRQSFRRFQNSTYLSCILKGI